MNDIPKDPPAPEAPPFDGPEDDEEDAFPGVELDLGQEDSGPASLARGAAVIKSFWRHAPNGPGVYRMFAQDGEVLYVGKARSIKKRVASYTKPEQQSVRIARMIAQTASMVFVSTETEAEALLLEANFIKQMKPRYNVLLRDDKSFPYILISGDHEAPQLLKHRGARTGKGNYFGPFANVGAVHRTLNALQRAFLLRTCSDSYYENRTRPCLLYQIKRCAAPCTGEISLDDYSQLVGETRDFLSGRSRAIRHRLAAEMGEAAEDLAFEKAARLRDRIAALSAIQGEQSINPKSIPEADVFAVAEEAGQFCIEVFFFRTYQNWGNRAYFPRADRSLGPAEVLDAFLAQFYLERPAPRLVLLSHDIESHDALCEALSVRSGRRIAVGAPKRGEKRELVENAMRNAREALSRKLADTATQEKLLGALASAFGVDHPIRRVEVYDNSHIMGTNAIGAMIVAGADGFVKNQYRTFNIKSTNLTPGDDYAMMREVLGRRFARLAEKDYSVPAPDATAAFPDRPDLVLVDGGRGQFEEARKIFAELGIEGIRLAAIAKGPDRNAGRETFFVEGREPFRLAPRDPALYFVQRLRDEAHRFAIGTHRAKRKKEFVKSPLDEIPGIGPARKRALLNAFGTAKGVAGAGLTDLEKAPGVNAATAKIVYDFFHEVDRN
ncbi:excinuclease ABC subunit UvrC [Methylocapsa sp. S129]|uniref:excinuclease ABC subunit UvrC n=1 Tax=Methylocapsa sp. S129 TaxID=1641869 RepID=UPI00131C501A|nr:excinuclease ABC subunit UvrC [Methylocapsa sp. S129]